MIRKRILQFLDYKGDTKYKFYQKTGFANGFLDKEGNIGSDKCEKICYEYPDLSLEWLIMGKGEMLKETMLPAVSSSQSQENDNEVIALLKENNATLKDQLRDKERILTFQEERIKNLEQEILNLKKQTKSPSPASFMAKKPL